VVLWLHGRGFTLPSAIALILFALGLARHGDALLSGALHGLKVVAVAVVAQAVWGMAGQALHRPRPHHPDGARGVHGAGAADGVDPGRGDRARGAGRGWRCSERRRRPGCASPRAATRRAASSGARAGGLGPLPSVSVPLAGVSEPDSGVLGANTGAPGPRSGWLWLAAFFALLAALPLLVALQPDGWLARVDAFYRSGALVFGGGHVVLPLLQAEVVPTGWVDGEAFLAGYGAAQAVPGPLFTFAAFLGAAAQDGYGGWVGGIVCLLAVFAPSFLLVAGALPFWERLRGDARMQAALAGINAAVVGLLLAALYQPVWTSAIHRPQDFALGLVALVALMSWKWPPWLVVAACGVAGGVLSA
jgi:chromate transporter